jgi:hypothetical protein
MMMKKTMMTTTKETKKAAAKKAAAKSAAVKTATKPTNGSHPFLSKSADEPMTCVTCGEAPSGKLHRRYMDAARRLWRTGTKTDRAVYLQHITDSEPGFVTMTWTALPAYTKRSLAACIVLEEA